MERGSNRKKDKKVDNWLGRGIIGIERGIVRVRNGMEIKEVIIKNKIERIEG